MIQNHIIIIVYINYFNDLIYFLNSLYQAVFPLYFLKQYNNDIKDIKLWINEVLSLLPNIHYNVFIYLIQFLLPFYQQSNAKDLFIKLFSSCIMQTYNQCNQIKLNAEQILLTCFITQLE